MHIAIEWHDKNFNVNLSSKDGADVFLSIKGCRIVSSPAGEFIGWPASKNEGTGKWWRHVWGSDKFAAAVLEAAKKAQPRGQSRPSKSEHEMDDDIPF